METITLSGGLILPLTAILGIVAFFFLTNYFIKNWKINLKYLNPMLVSIIIFGTIILGYTILSYALYSDIQSVVLSLQFLSGLVGIFISIYFVKFRKMDIKEIFRGIAIVFFIAIISNIVLSIMKIGVTSTFSRGIYAATPLGGIYQILIYFPFILANVFLFSLPFWKSKYSKIMFIIITLYLLSIQVKGAIILFVTGVIIYYWFFSQNNVRRNRIILIFVVTMMIVILPKEFLLGRFISSSGNLISGREIVWQEYFIALKNNPSLLITGSFVKAKGISTKVGNITGGGYHSFHNQYLEILDSYGLIIFSLFIVTIINFLKKIYNKIKFLKNEDAKVYTYFFIVILLNLILDLNINVPLRVTNPAIILYFYWTTIFLTLEDKTNNTNENV